MARDREMDFWYHAMVVLVSRDLILEKCHLFHTSRIVDIEGSKCI